jgi:hypothetical protein
MSIVAGQPVKASTDNAAFISKINGGDTVGIIGLKNSGSGGDIVNLQQYINKIALALGDMTEAGSNELDYTSVNYIADNMTHKQAIEALDAQLSITQGMVDDHETRLLNAEATIVNHENRIDSLETGNMTIAGNKTFSGSTVFSGDVEMTGTVTQINSVNTIIADPLLTLNNNGTNVTAEDAGFEVERPLGNGQVLFDSALDSKWKVGVVGSMYQVLVSGIAQTVSGIKDFVSGLKSDTISESTLNAGVTIDGVLVKDGLVDGRDVSTDGTDLDNHIGNSSIHFTEGSINHANITNIGTNTHAQIDSHIASTSNPHGVTAAQVGLTNVTDDAQLKRAAGDYNSFTLKATPVAADVVLIEDSADSFNKKKITLTDLIGGGGGATTALDNLASTAVNADIIPATNLSIALGSSTKFWLNSFVSTTNTNTIKDTVGAGTNSISVNSRVLYDSAGSSVLEWGSTGIKTVKPVMRFSAQVGSYSTTTTISMEDTIILASASGGSITLTLPAAATYPGKVYKIKKTDSSANTVTIDGNASETIDGTLVKYIDNQYDSIEIVSDGTNWAMISDARKIGSTRVSGSALSIPHNISTPVDFASNIVTKGITWTAGAGYNSVTGTWTTEPKFTIIEPGWYETTAQLLYGSHTLGIVEYAVFIRTAAGIRTRAENFAQATASTFAHTGKATFKEYLNAGDVIAIHAYQTSGVNRSLHTDSSFNQVTVQRVST